MKSEFYEDPYHHVIYDNFLDDKTYIRIVQLYKKEQFKELKTDLFSFLQTNELIDKIGFFTKELDKILKKEPGKEYHYTAFASYYRKNDYLLCHDDCVDGREYAFTYYLDDYESGELKIYEKDCTVLNKAIEVKRNRLVVFRVESTSFHEVAKCNSDGRKAITGWLYSNDRKLKHHVFMNNLEETQQNNVTYVDLPIDPLTSDQNAIQALDLSGFKENIIKTRIQGPFVDRRVFVHEIEEFVCFTIPGLTLEKYCFLGMDSDSYILCNDRINMMNDDLCIYDGFLFQNNHKSFIKYVDENGQVAFAIDADKGMFVILRRNKYKIFISGPSEQVNFYHFIYSK
ncbi:OGFD1 [Enterospora canceri]|uniref:OGFD1 n=1 Tax=Enterospora canceri TaxID=1081671 RepID=A0A1Y1S5F7_9MICR|nr:OGFD1 [Enterospora canceri]